MFLKIGNETEPIFKIEISQFKGSFRLRRMKKKKKRRVRGARRVGYTLK